MNLHRCRNPRLLPTLCALVAGIVVSLGSIEAADERDISAALTIRMAKFIGWPDRPVLEADQPFFIIGVMGGGGTQAAFSKFQGGSVQGKRVKVVKILPSTDFRDLRRCHIVYGETKRDVGLIRQMVESSKGVLTVSGPGSARRNATCLALVNKSGKLAFDIDLKLTRKASLGVDAGLIRLANNVTK